MPRIAFTGAAGTGKSYLAKLVEGWFKIPICPVGSRTVAKDMGFLNPYDVDRAGARSEFQHRLCEMKLAWEYEHGAFVTDRSHFDNLAYTILHAVDSVDEAFVEKIRIANQVYTHVIHIDASGEGAFMDLTDPQRHQSRVYHRHYAMLLCKLWEQYEPELSNTMRSKPTGMLWLNTNDLAERTRMVWNFLAPLAPMSMQTSALALCECSGVIPCPPGQCPNAGKKDR